MKRTSTLLLLVLSFTAIPYANAQENQAEPKQEEAKEKKKKPKQKDAKKKLVSKKWKKADGSEFEGAFLKVNKKMAIFKDTQGEKQKVSLEDLHADVVAELNKLAEAKPKKKKPKKPAEENK